jgi:hypothetical protein
MKTDPMRRWSMYLFDESMKKSFSTYSNLLFPLGCSNSRFQKPQMTPWDHRQSDSLYLSQHSQAVAQLIPCDHRKPSSSTAVGTAAVLPRPSRADMYSAVRFPAHYCCKIFTTSPQQAASLSLNYTIPCTILHHFMCHYQVASSVCLTRSRYKYQEDSGSNGDGCPRTDKPKLEFGE